jgi:O-antigen/teichoic acid export membrane protein
MQGNNNSNVAATIARYAASRYFRIVLGAVTAFARPRLLAVEHYGVWTLLKIIPRYAAYLHLGARDAMRFFLPYHAAKKDYDTVESIKSSVFFSSLLLNLVLAAALLCAYVAGGFSTEVKLGLATMAIVVLLEFYLQYIVVLLRAHERFALLGRFHYVDTVSTFVLTIPLLYARGIYGLYVALIVSRLVVVLFLRTRFPTTVRRGFGARRLLSLVRRGGPIMLCDFMIDLVTTSDRWIVALLLGGTALGHYGIATMVFAFLIQLPGTAREVLEPRAMKDMDDSMSGTFLRQHLVVPTINLAYLMPFVIAPCYFCLPPTIALLLPRYTAGIAPAQVLICGVYFLALAYIPRPIIVANGWQLRVAPWLPCVLMLNVALSARFVAAGRGLAGVAFGSSVAFFALFVVLTAFVARQFHPTPIMTRGEKLCLALPFPFMIAMIALLQYIAPLVTMNRYLAAAGSSLVFCAATLALHRAAAKYCAALVPLKMPSARSR